MKRIAAAALVAGVVSASVSTAVAATYSLTELAPLSSFAASDGRGGVNKSGDVAGYSYDGGAGVAPQATSWSGVANTPSTLSPVTGYTGSIAEAINNKGQVAGSSTNPSGFPRLATRWDTTTSSPTALNPVAGEPNSGAFGINNSGDVAGWSFGSKGTATIWDGKTNAPIALKSSAGGRATGIAYDINDKGNLVGSTTEGAVLWDSATSMPTTLDPLMSRTTSFAHAINEHGSVVGYSCNNSTKGCLGSLATLWDTSDYEPSVLDPLSGFDESTANDISDSGAVVGNSRSSITGARRATLWIAGVAIDLTSLLGPLDVGWVLIDADGINELGQISGIGLNALGQTRAFKLTPAPVPLPAALPLFLSALGFFGFMGWRRRRAAA